MQVGDKIKYRGNKYELQEINDTEYHNTFLLTFERENGQQLRLTSGSYSKKLQNSEIELIENSENGGEFIKDSEE